MQLYNLFLSHNIRFNSKICLPYKYKGKRNAKEERKNKMEKTQRKEMEKRVGLHYWANFSKCVLSKC